MNREKPRPTIDGAFASACAAGAAGILAVLTTQGCDLPISKGGLFGGVFGVVFVLGVNLDVRRQARARAKNTTIES